ncbi:hypothetical protein HY213_01545 [Candidatus Peregrinibacteria bacterium]|nr:hypothetical protein [Candidatus Peregrinibacteria bacterium]
MEAVQICEDLDGVSLTSAFAVSAPPLDQHEKCYHRQHFERHERQVDKKIHLCSP